MPGPRDTLVGNRGGNRSLGPTRGQRSRGLDSGFGTPGGPGNNGVDLDSGFGPQPPNAAREELNRRLRGPAQQTPSGPRSPGNSRTATRQTPEDFGDIIWSGERAPLAIVYGRARVRAFPWVFEQSASSVVFGFVVALGEIQQIEDVYINSVLFDSGSADFDGWEVNTYTGTGSQTADPLLSAAISGSPAYDDDLDGTGTFSGEGIAYVVISAPGNAINGVPAVEAVVKGRKVLDTRPSPDTTAYSDNPALCLADLITSDVYGWGKTVDTSSVEAAADACDELVSGEKRRVIGYALYDPRPTTEVVQELADLAGVMLDRSGDTIRFVPDRPRSTDLILSEETQIISSSYQRKRTSRIPAAVEVSWYDADAGREKSVREPDTQTDNLWRVRMAGIPNYNQALREAKERYNRATLEDLTADIVVAGVGNKIQRGDVVAVTDRTIAITAKPFRVESVTIQQPGIHRLGLVEYQAAVYSDDAGSEPVIEDTGFSGQNFAAPQTPESNVFETSPPTNTGRSISGLLTPRNGSSAYSWRIGIKPPSEQQQGIIREYEIKHYDDSSPPQLVSKIIVDAKSLDFFGGEVVLQKGNVNVSNSYEIGGEIPGGIGGYSEVRAISIYGAFSQSLTLQTYDTRDAVVPPIFGNAPGLSASITSGIISVSWDRESLAGERPDHFTLLVIDATASPEVVLDKRSIPAPFNVTSYQIDLPKPNSASSYTGRLVGYYSFTGEEGQYFDFSIS